MVIGKEELDNPNDVVAWFNSLPNSSYQGHRIVRVISLATTSYHDYTYNAFALVELGPLF